jgi:hypothetical protein
MHASVFEHPRFMDNNIVLKILMQQGSVPLSKVIRSELTLQCAFISSPHLKVYQAHDGLTEKYTQVGARGER